MALDFPTSLPCPQTELVTPFDRAQRSDDRRPRDTRALSLDRLAVVRASWPPLALADAAALYSFWETDLLDGGAWFNATWPLPQGRVPAVFKFISQPRFKFVPGGRWSVDAVLEQRGRGQSVISGAAPGVPSNPWNSANELGTVVFTDSDFTATAQTPATVASVEAAEGILGNGKYYAELVPTFDFFEGGAARVQLGVTRSNPGSASDGAAYDLSGDIYVDGNPVDTFAAIDSGDVIMIALDAFFGIIYFGKNGAWLGGADPDTDTGGIALSGGTADYWLSFYCDNTELPYSCAIRDGTDRQSYPVPTGFTAWNIQGAE